MERFNYRAVNTSGRPVRGAISAANEADLYQQLKNQGLELIDCKQVGGNKSRFSFMKGRIQVRDLIQLFVHLEQLQLAGVPLLEGLADIRDSTESSRLRDIMTEVHREVSEGSQLSEALASHPGTFGHIFISLIGAGEETGNLTESFRQLVEHLKWTDAMRSKVKKATRYPIVLLVVILLVITVMMGHVVPQIVDFLRNVDLELPLATILLISVSDWFKQFWWLVFAVPLGIFLIIKFGYKLSEGFAYRMDYVFLHVPVFGPLIRKISLARFAQTFAVLFLSGLEILRCLDSARQTVHNRVLGEALDRVKEQVQEGSPLSHALNASGEFPSLVTRMVSIGEESGNLTSVLKQVAEFYDKDVDEQVDALISMIEPALTVVLGAVILWIAVGVFGPIYNSFGEMGI